MGRRPQLVPALLSGALLLGALGEHPYGYFTLLRWVVCLSAALVAVAGTKAGKPLVPLPFILLALLFNPIVPVFMSREEWRPVDVIAALMFFGAASIAVPLKETGARVEAAPITKAPVGPPPAQPAAASPDRGALARPEQPGHSAAPGVLAEADDAVAPTSPDALLAQGRRLWSQHPRDIDQARTALLRAAECGSVETLEELGFVLEHYADPPDIAGARSAYERAADLGGEAGTFSLVELLLNLDPPDVEGARTWVERAAAAGHSDVSVLFGDFLLTYVEPPDVVGARHAYERAAALGDTAAMGFTRYPPDGVRGVSGITRAARYGQDRGYLHGAADQICVIAQVESASGLDNLEAIAATPGVDVVFIGPSDLAADLGHLGDAQHPEVQAAVDDAFARLHAIGAHAGYLTLDAAEARRRLAEGVDVVGVAADVTIIRRGLASLSSDIGIPLGEEDAR